MENDEDQNDEMEHLEIAVNRKWSLLSFPDVIDLGGIHDVDDKQWRNTAIGKIHTKKWFDIDDVKRELIRNWKIKNKFDIGKIADGHDFGVCRDLHKLRTQHARYVVEVDPLQEKIEDKKLKDWQEARAKKEETRKMMQVRSKWVNSQGEFETIGEDVDLTIESRELVVHDGRKITNVEENGEKIKVTEAQQVEEKNVTNNGNDQVSKGLTSQVEMMEDLLEGNNMEATVMDFSPQPKIGSAMKVDSVKIQSVVMTDVNTSAGKEAINEEESTIVLVKKPA
ncbi:hypothetical protein FRX31_003719 [Thalictrum thalictroides]|uniref:Uncharacterized protein n=1 Tax=Thalictrum thalictroides TaxID=46969 RepID=A0A7J6XCW1_THATH|nr:hypothetical protein FRX31_003719 [Thalictrum thalictroides]